MIHIGDAGRTLKAQDGRRDLVPTLDARLKLFSMEADRPNLVKFSWVGRFPAVPHWECLVVSCPCKILLRNTASTLSIKESGTPVRGLRSKSRPFVIAPELAIPIIFCERFLPVSHLVSS